MRQIFDSQPVLCRCEDSAVAEDSASSLFCLARLARWFFWLVVVFGVSGSQPRDLVHQNYPTKCVCVAAHHNYHLVRYERLRRDTENCSYSRTKLQECGARLFYGLVHASSATFGITCCTAVCVDVESNRKINVIQASATVVTWPESSIGLI
jgi:hypothetical protein